MRKVSFGVGVERTFPVHSPTIAKLEVATYGDVRRAKLYYLRDLLREGGQDQGEADRPLVTGPSRCAFVRPDGRPDVPCARMIRVRG